MTTIEQANKFLAKLDAAVLAGLISQMDACDEVFSEMESGEHDSKIEDIYYNYTRK